MNLQKSIKELQELQKEFDLNHEGDEPFYQEINNKNIEALEHLIVCLVGEVGEFSNIVKKIKRGDFKYSEKSSELSEELADTFIYLIKIANQMNLDLETIFLDKLDKNKTRFEHYKK